MPISAAFFAQLRKPCNGKPALFQKFTQAQVNALNTITAVFDSFDGHNHCADDLAYVMATVRRECGAALDLTIKEYGRGARKPYGKPAGQYGLIYYGRGPTQCTWLKNYQVAKTATGIDFVRYPDLMCDPIKGTTYMIEAMYAGRFTTHSLRNYITPGVVTTHAAFAQARRIVNGLDHADEVADFAMAFQAALNVGYSAPVKSLPTLAHQSSQPLLSLWACIVHIFGGR